ncbi:hypothetical protein K438DRAFT_2029894 [Mycena galopus ATCC 62051]|nr:hypothetical protein K438DRAFT_2029894 [Mycena galopus ATCC 62051]
MSLLVTPSVPGNLSLKQADIELSLPYYFSPPCVHAMDIDTSLRFGAPSLPTPTPQPVVLHANASRVAAHRYGLVRGHRHADPVFTGVLRRAWTCARTATSVSYPSAIDTPSRTTPASKARLSVPPHHPARRRPLAALLPPSCSSALHASQEAHSVMDTSTFFHFWCATQLSNASCAEFSAYRNLDGYEAAAATFRLSYTLSPSTPCPFLLISPRAVPRIFCLLMIYPFFVPPSPPRVRLHSSSLSTDDPVSSFALAPSFPLHHPVRASLRNPGPCRPSLPLPLLLCVRPSYFPCRVLIKLGIVLLKDLK